MATELQKFMKKVGKLDKTDYVITVYPIATNSEMITQFHITLIDYNKELKLYTDYTNRKRVDDLLEWLDHYYDGIDDCVEDGGDVTYFFHADSFSVRLEFLSNQLN